MNNIPRVKTKEQAQAVCKVASWELVSKSTYPHCGVRKKGDTSDNYYGESEDFSQAKQAVNNALHKQWKRLSPSQQARIRAICGDKEKR